MTTRFIKNFDLYNKKNNNNIEIITNININDIENKINKILDDNEKLCKYYIICDKGNEHYFVSLKFDTTDCEYINIIKKTSFEIYIYKDEKNNSILFLTPNINNHNAWINIKNSLLNIKY